MEELRSEKQDEHIANYHEITRKALDKANKAIDMLPDAMSASDIKSMVVTGATATDKARLLSGLSTSNAGKASDLTALADRFKKIEANHRAIQDSVCATQDKSDS
jgi:hypothetical protein